MERELANLRSKLDEALERLDRLATMQACVM